MLIKYETPCCPEDRPGAVRWTLSLPLSNGDDYLEISMGRRGRDAILFILSQEEADSLVFDPLSESESESERRKSLSKFVQIVFRVIFAFMVFCTVMVVWALLKG